MIQALPQRYVEIEARLDGLQWFAMVDLTGRASAQAEVYVSKDFSDCIATMFPCIECFNSMLWRAMTGRRTAERYGDIW